MAIDIKKKAEFPSNTLIVASPLVYAERIAEQLRQIEREARLARERSRAREIELSEHLKQIARREADAGVTRL